MQAIISADSSMHQVKVQGKVKSEMQGKAGVLGSEIKLDAARGGDVTKKKEELADVEEKAHDITASQMNILSDANKKFEEAAKADREAARADNKDKADEKNKIDKNGNKSGVVSSDGEIETDIVQGITQNYEPIDVISRGVSVSNGSIAELFGKAVDVKL
jgi:hypothetical protein